MILDINGLTKSFGAKTVLSNLDLKIEDHDRIGLIGEKYGEVSLIKEPYILYRRHGATVTGGSTTLKQKIIWRAAIIRRLHESRLAYE